MEYLKYVVLYLPHRVKIINPQISSISISELVYETAGKFYVKGKIPISVFCNMRDFGHLRMLLHPMSQIDSIVDELELIRKVEHPTTSKMMFISSMDRLLNNNLPYPYRINYMPYWIVTELIKRHFDIFGLIPQAKAISISSLCQDKAVTGD